MKAFLRQAYEDWAFSNHGNTELMFMDVVGKVMLLFLVLAAVVLVPVFVWALINIFRLFWGI